MPITRNVLQEPNQDEDPDTDLWLDTTDPQHETTPSKIISFITTRKINFNDIDQNLKSTFNHLEPEQQQTRKICQQFYQRYQGNGYLNYPKHIKFASDGLLDDLEHYFKSLDASRPWLCYWSVHALKILRVDGMKFLPRVENAVLQKLDSKNIFRMGTEISRVLNPKFSKDTSIEILTFLTIFAFTHV